MEKKSFYSFSTNFPKSVNPFGSLFDLFLLRGITSKKAIYSKWANLNSELNKSFINATKLNKLIGILTHYIKFIILMANIAMELKMNKQYAGFVWMRAKTRTL